MDTGIHSPLLEANTASAQSANSLDAAYSQHAHRKAGRGGWGKWLTLSLLLLGANAAVWIAYTSNYQTIGVSGEQASQDNIAPQKIMPLTDKQATSIAGPVPLPAPAAVSATDTNSSEKSVCMLWEFTNNSDLKRADNRLSEQAWSGYDSEQAKEPSTYLVYTGPFEKQAEMDAKIKLLEKMKIKDYRKMPDGAISLGVLSTPEAASALRKTLTKRGLLGIESTERTGSGKRTRYRFDGLSPNSVKELNALSSGLGLLKPCT
jgi:hypothetical protein